MIIIDGLFVVLENLDPKYTNYLTTYMIFIFLGNRSTFETRIT